MVDPWAPDPDPVAPEPLPPEPLLPEPLGLGPHPLGAPTVDSDGDGRPDTVVAGPGAAGPPHGLLLATDTDADGRVDVATLIGSDGTATTWGPDTWERGWDAPAPPGPVFDPVTGRWSRMV